MPPSTTRSIACLLAALVALASGTWGATYPVTDVVTSGNQFVSLTTNGLSWGQPLLARGTLTAYAGASTGVVLMSNGAAVPPSGTRAGLVGDWLLDTGIINPAVGPAVATVTFPQAIVNRAGPDLVFMEINPGTSADPMQVTINGTTRTVASGEWGATGYATASADVLSTPTPPATLAALEAASLTVTSPEIAQAVFGVAIDLSDFGLAAGASITSVSFGSIGAAPVDPVFIAGFIADGVPPAGAVTLPYVETFAAGPGSFTPANAAEWAVTGGVYRNTITNTSAGSSTSVLTNELGGDPLTAHGFFCSGKFTVVTNGNSANVVGLALFGTNAVFSGGVTFPYYLVEVRPAGSTLRVRRVGINDTQFLPETSLGTFTLNPALAFTLELSGTYENGVLRMGVTVRQNAASSTFYVVDSEPLTVGYFGFRNRTNGGVLTVDCDDFTLRHLSTLTFTGAPAPFARAGSAYYAEVAAASDTGATVTLDAPTRPAWMNFTPGAGGTGTLTGTPPAPGGYSVTLSATDNEGGAAEQTFNVSALEPTGVFISEFLAENETGLRDEDGDQEDWIELFNADTAPADVGGWWLSDDPALPTKWAIPAGVTIPARGFLVVFASGKNRTADPARLHTSFKLNNAAGSHLSLAQSGGAVVSSYALYPPQRADHSYGAFASYTPRGYFITPTPGAPNDAIGYAGFVADTEFSVKRGFYTTPQGVVVTCATPGATLVYTTNGSTPTLTNGTPATSPLTLNIGATTTLRVAAFAPGLIPSGPDTQSYFFLEDIRTQGTPAGWPTGTVNGQILDYGMDPDITGSVTPQQMKNALAALPTLSLVTDLPNLFDPKDGIYVNPYGREEGFECPVSVEMLNADNTPAFHINAGLRIRGGASRVATNPKHNFHLYFRGEYGASKLAYPLFGDEGADEFDRVDLRTAQVMSWHSGGDTNATYNRDEWNRLTHGAMGDPYTRSRYYHLYLNGRYWGIYGTQERADSDFAASYFGGAKADYDVMKTYVIPHRVDPADGDNAAWAQLHSAALAGFTSDAAYFAVEGKDANGAPNGNPPLLDVDNLIDYTLLRFYAGDDDAPVNISVAVPKNFYAIRPRDGRFGFRFLTHDAESTMISRDVTPTITTGNTLAYFNPRWLSQQLAANAKYRLRFADRAQRHFYGGALDNTSALTRWQALRAELSGAMLAESARWGDAKSPSSPRTVAQWNAANDAIETGFIPGRRAAVIGQLRTRGLFPSLNAPTFSQQGGNVPSGFGLTISAPAATTIFYTTNGTDPTNAGSPTYAGPIVLNGVQVTVKARAKLNSTGEWSALTEALFTLDATPAGPGDLAISEIHFNPPGPDDDTEFVELVNISAGRLDLVGVHFTGAMVFTFGNLTLEPGARVLVVENTAAFTAAYGPTPVVAGQWTGALNNGGDTLILLAANDDEIERVTYADTGDWPASADGDGYSLVRINLNAPGDAANWRTSTALGGNPGASDAAPFVSNPIADADGDGLKAIAEHFLGTSDTNGASGHGVIVAGRTIDGRATLTFPRRLGADDLVLIVEVSTDLGAWTATATRSGHVNHGNGMATETWTANGPAMPQFMRLRLVKQ